MKKIGMIANIVTTCFFFSQCLLLNGCSSSSNSDATNRTTESDTGAIAVQVRWHPLPNDSHIQPKFNCGEADDQVYRVISIVFDDQGDELARTEGEGWDCNTHTGTINNIDAGSDRSLVILGRSFNGSIIARGETTSPITIQAGHTETVAVDTYPFRPTLAAPTDIVSLTSSDVRLSWDAMTGAVSYRIQIALDDQFNQQIEDTTTSDTTYSLSITTNGTYYWRVRSIDSLQNLSGWSENSFQMELTSHVITASAGAGGSINPSGEVNASNGDAQSFTISAQPGYYLSGLIVDGAAVEDVPVPTEYQFLNITGSHTIAAVFTPVWYVNGNWDGSVTGTPDGRSWNTAFPTIQEAITAASAGHEIWVRGTVENRTTTARKYLPTSRIVIAKNIAVFGGFSGDEVHVAQREPERYSSIIDGADLTVGCFNILADSTLDGLVVQNGRSEAVNQAQGGAIVVSDVALNIADCAFYSNMTKSNSCRGGAIYNDGGTLIIDNTQFQANSNGGVSDALGGAIFSLDAEVRITGCTFDSNTVTATNNEGGAISNENTIVTIEHCLFTENGSLEGGGFGGAVSNKNCNAAIVQSTFTGNISYQGGAIYCGGGTALISNCILARNIARQNGGGAIYNYSAEPVINSCTIVENQATGDLLPWLFPYGGAMFNSESNPEMINSIIWGNTSQDGTQIYNADTSSTNASYCNIEQAGFTGNGNISQTPRLDACYHYVEGSPGMGAGVAGTDPAVDFDGEDRPIGSPCDIGADQYFDSGGEGLPDYWEILFGLNPAQDNSTGDLDNDGLTNLFEYVNSTDPSVPAGPVDAEERGRWDSTGAHDQDDDGTLTGRIIAPNIETNSYLIFNVSGLADTTIQSAALRLELAGYNSSDLTEVLEIYHVSTNAATLKASGTEGVDIFNDLEDGDLFGEMEISIADPFGTIITIPLSDEAVAGINSAIGGSGYFSLGLHLGSSSAFNDNQVSFSTASEVRTHQLVLHAQ